MVKRTQQPEVLPATLDTNPDVQEVAAVSAGVTAWLANMRAFFAAAAVLEQQASARNRQALAIRTIATSSEQAEVQQLALASRAGKDRIEEHWSPVAKLFNRLHKCVTGGRARAVKLEDAAFEHLNRLNNQFNAEQERKAWEESERIRREKEAEERRRQEAEAAELERAAAEAEANSPDLSEREQRFVDEYVRNAPDGVLQDRALAIAAVAAKMAGYKSPERQRGILLASPKIQAAITAARQAIAIRQQAEAVKAQPIVVVTEEVAPDVAGAAKTATRWKARVTDEDALIAAVIAGTVPRDVLTVDTARVSQYATALQGQLNTWPGVEAWDDTRIRR